MSNSSTVYNNLLRQAVKERNKLVGSSLKETVKIYEDAADDLIKKAQTASGGFTRAWSADYEKFLRHKILELNSELVMLSESSIKTSAEIAASVQGDFLSYIGGKYHLDIDKDMLEYAYKTNTDVINQIIKGGFYKDGKSLSSRIWNYGNQYGKDIQYILSKGLAEQKSYLEIIKDLEQFLKPNGKGLKTYTSLYNRKVEFNAQRLLRTSVTHMFRAQADAATIKNPYVEAGKWNLSDAHYERQVAIFGEDICDEHANQDKFNLGRGCFPKDNIPTQHPQCLCYITYEIPKSLDDIGRELRDWINGADNNSLDRWLKDNG